MEKLKIVIVDDHKLISDSLKKLIESFPDYKVQEQLLNGSQLINYLDGVNPLPDLVLLDVNMPVMDGKETIKWLYKNHPELKVLVLSMENDEETILFMLRHGAKGYVLKDIHPNQFKTALDNIIHKGFHHSDMINDILLDEYLSPTDLATNFNDRETHFLKLVCTDKTYKEIASEMHLSPKTIDGYRESLFKKLGVRNRIGLALYVVKNGIVKL